MKHGRTQCNEHPAKDKILVNRTREHLYLDLNYRQSCPCLAGIFNKYSEIVELRLSYALSDRLGGTAIQVEKQSSWERKAVFQGQETILKRSDSLSNLGSPSSLGLPEIHGKRNLEKGSRSQVCYDFDNCCLGIKG